MIRQINLMNGFFDLNTSNLGYYSSTSYPQQKSSAIGKWTGIRYRNEAINRPAYIFCTADGVECEKREDGYYYRTSGKRVPETNYEGKKTQIKEEVINPSINNRFRIMKHDYDLLSIPNSGEPTLFQILRYDDPMTNNHSYEHKVILRSTTNEIIVLPSETFELLYDLEGSDFLRRAKYRANKAKEEYYSVNLTDDESVFFNEYNDEYINIYPIQDEDLLGLNVYTEFIGSLVYIDTYGRELYLKNGKYYYSDTGELVPSRNSTGKKANALTPSGRGDLFDKDADYNIMPLKEYATEDGDPLIKSKDSYYYYDKFFGEGDKRNKKYTGKVKQIPANKFYNTDYMRTAINDNDHDSRGYKNEMLDSYKYYHNNYRESIANIPRRAHNQGIVIRADLNATNPQVVVMEHDDSGKVRFVCQDEAKFYFDTLTKTYDYATLGKAKLI